MKLIPPRRAAILAPLAAVVALLALTLPGIHRKSVWYDEGFSLALAQIPESPGAALRACRATAHPPLYHLALFAAVKPPPLAPRAAAGRVAPAWPPRLLSVAFAAGAVVAAFFLGRVLLDESAGGILALGLAVSPVVVHYAVELRMYSLLLLLAALQTLFAARWADGGRRRDAAGFAICSALAVLTHYYALFYLAGLGLWVVVEFWRRERSAAAALKRIAPWALLGAALLAPWAPALLEHGRAHSLSGSMAVEREINRSMLFDLLREGLFGPAPSGPFTAAIGPHWRNLMTDMSLGMLLFGGLAIAGALRLGRLEREAAAAAAGAEAKASRLRLAAFGVGIPLLLTAFHIALKGRFYPRYAIVFLPLGFFVCGEGLRAARARWGRAALAALALLFLLPTDAQLIQRDARDHTLPAAQWLAASLRPADRVVHTGAWSYLPFRYYLGSGKGGGSEAAQRLADSDGLAAVERALLPPEEILAHPERARLEGGGRLWVVISLWDPERARERERELLRPFGESGWRPVDSMTWERGLKRVSVVGLAR